jgi:hypothetical protein
MTDTPETDNLARGNHVVPTEFAQDLERQLNIYRRALNMISNDCTAWLHSENDLPSVDFVKAIRAHAIEVAS